MKRKFLILTLCFTIFISSINFNMSYADEVYFESPIFEPSISDHSLSLSVGSYYISKQAFNVIVGFAAASGIVFLNESSKHDLVSNFFDTFTRADSGEFTTYKEFDELLKNDSKLEPPKNDNDDNKIVIGATILNVLTSIFDKMFTRNEPILNKEFYTDIPIYPKELVPDYSENVETNINFRDISIKAYKSSGTNPYNLEYNFGKSISKNIYSFSLYPTGEKGYYYLRYGNYYDPYLKDSNKNFIKFYIPSSNLSGTYNPSSSNKFNDSLIDDIFHPSVEPSFDLDLPFEEGKEELPEQPEVLPVPTFPNLSDIDFSSFDFSSLGSLFNNLKGKFPFSIPFDIYNIISSLVVEPVAPVFEIPIVSEFISLDLTEFNELANIVRMFIVLGWLFVLFTFTKKLGG